VWTAGILVTGKEVATKKREPMIFVSFEDEQSIFETVLFPDAFERFYPLLDDGWAFLIFGRVEDDLGALAISVERLVTISRRTGEAVARGADAGEEAAAAAPERPPVFMWGRVPAAVPRGLGVAAAT
jgi:DNA polymerase III alpha subunit